MGNMLTTQEIEKAVVVHMRRGITQRKTGKYQAQIRSSTTSQVLHLGAFDTAEEAARAFDRGALKQRGKAAVLNFPASDYPDTCAKLGLTQALLSPHRPGPLGTLSQSSTRRPRPKAKPSGLPVVLEKSNEANAPFKAGARAKGAEGGSGAESGAKARGRKPGQAWIAKSADVAEKPGEKKAGQATDQEQKYRGVSKRQNGKWQAKIQSSVTGREMHLGIFDTPVEGARVYDMAALRQWGDRATLNFPASSYEELNQASIPPAEPKPKGVLPVEEKVKASKVRKAQKVKPAALAPAAPAPAPAANATTPLAPVPAPKAQAPAPKPPAPKAPEPAPNALAPAPEAPAPAPVALAEAPAVAPASAEVAPGGADAVAVVMSPALAPEPHPAQAPAVAPATSAPTAVTMAAAAAVPMVAAAAVTMPAAAEVAPVTSAPVAASVALEGPAVVAGAVAPETEAPASPFNPAVERSQRLRKGTKRYMSDGLEEQDQGGSRSDPGSSEDVRSAKKPKRVATTAAASLAISSSRQGNPGNGGTFKEVAAYILDQERRLMTPGEIARLALQRRLLRVVGKTPEASMSAALNTDIKRKDRASTFFRPQEGVFGLQEWNTLGVEYARPDHRRVHDPRSARSLRTYPWPGAQEGSRSPSEQPPSARRRPTWLPGPPSSDTVAWSRRPVGSRDQAVATGRYATAAAGGHHGTKRAREPHGYGDGGDYAGGYNGGYGGGYGAGAEHARERNFSGQYSGRDKWARDSGGWEAGRPEWGPRGGYEDDEWDEEGGWEDEEEQKGRLVFSHRHPGSQHYSRKEPRAPIVSRYKNDDASRDSSDGKRDRPWGSLSPEGSLSPPPGPRTGPGPAARRDPGGDGGRFSPAAHHGSDGGGRFSAAARHGSGSEGQFLSGAQVGRPQEAAKPHVSSPGGPRSGLGQFWKGPEQRSQLDPSLWASHPLNKAPAGHPAGRDGRSPALAHRVRPKEGLWDRAPPAARDWERPMLGRDRVDETGSRGLLSGHTGGAAANRAPERSSGGEGRGDAGDGIIRGHSFDPESHELAQFLVDFSSGAAAPAPRSVPVPENAAAGHRPPQPLAAKRNPYSPLSVRAAAAAVKPEPGPPAGRFGKSYISPAPRGAPAPLPASSAWLAAGRGDREAGTGAGNGRYGPRIGAWEEGLSGWEWEPDSRDRPVLNLAARPFQGQELREDGNGNGRYGQHSAPMQQRTAAPTAGQDDGYQALEAQKQGKLQAYHLPSKSSLLQ